MKRAYFIALGVFDVGVRVTNRRETRDKRKNYIIIIIIIIIINVTYMAQIRINAANASRIDCYVYCSLCHQKCFQPSTKHRQWHVLSKCSW